mmetsp:Transcript_5521/g.34159  ORF Transcript_5521/g.34159 Transcript_5521/m.34159 type:complete len:312 (-) Transcript_5521:14-949(-)
MLDLHGQLHDGRNDIVLALLQCFHGLGTRHAGLGHHQIDVLGLDAFLVHFSFLFLRFLFFRLGGCRFLVGRFHGTTESLGCLRLSLSGQVFDLSFTKDDVGVRGRALEHIGFVDHKQDVLGLPDGHTHHARDRFHPQLLHGFPALFFATALLSASFFFTVLHIFVGAHIFDLFFHFHFFRLRCRRRRNPRQSPAPSFRTFFAIVPRILKICTSPFQAFQPPCIVSFLFISVLSSALAADVDRSHAATAGAAWTDVRLPRPTPRVECVFHVASLRAHLGLHLCHVALCGCSVGSKSLETVRGVGYLVGRNTS